MDAETVVQIISRRFHAIDVNINLQKYQSQFFCINWYIFADRLELSPGFDYIVLSILLWIVLYM